MAGLGTGLSALLKENKQNKEARQAQEEQQARETAAQRSGAASAAGSAESGADSKYSVVLIAADKLQASVYQPRQSFDDESIAELAASIKEHGLMQPLLVKKQDDGKYSIICGERRFRACSSLRMNEIPCVISDAQDTDGYALALIENIQREDLNPLEQAQALQRMISECNLTQEALAKTLGLSRGAISHYLQLSRMQDEVKKLVQSGELSFSHAKVLFSLEGETQLKAAKYIVAHSLSVRKSEELVKELLAEGDNPEGGGEPRPRPAAPRLQRFESSLSQHFLGAKVKFSEKGETGKVVMSYTNAEQLAKIMEALGVDQAEYTSEPVEAMPIQN